MFPARHELATFRKRTTILGPTGDGTVCGILMTEIEDINQSVRHL